MKNNYSEKYFNSIYESLKKTEYKINSLKSKDQEFFDEINKVLLSIQKSDSRLFFIGNGASSSFSNHMALDFAKNGKIKAFSLSDSALLTALANDYSYEESAVEFLKINSVNSNDLVITISSSGNSKNIVNVLDFCSENKIKTLAFSGLKVDNLSLKKSFFSIYVPAYTYGIVECCHQVIIHLILDKFMNIYEWDRKTFQNMSNDNFNL